MVIKVLQIIFIILAINLVFMLNSVVHSQTTTEVAKSDNKTSDLQNQISEYQEKINELQGQTKSLSSQIKIADNQIKLTELKIRSNQEEVEELTKDIDTASTKVQGLENSLEQITAAFLNRTKGVYQAGKIQPFQIFLSSSSLSDAFSKLRYLKIVQKSDQRLVASTIQSKNNYEREKNLFESKKEKGTTFIIKYFKAKL